MGGYKAKPSDCSTNWQRSLSEAGTCDTSDCIIYLANKKTLEGHTNSVKRVSIFKDAHWMVVYLLVSLKIHLKLMTDSWPLTLKGRIYVHIYFWHSRERLSGNVVCFSTVSLSVKILSPWHTKFQPNKATATCIETMPLFTTESKLFLRSLWAWGLRNECLVQNGKVEQSN